MSVTVFESITSVRTWEQEMHRAGKVIGFVPTMGALHSGHISLINRARDHCDIVIVSIFVNPTQFNNPDDLKKYPRTFEEDLQLLEVANCDVLFYPSVKEIYPTPMMSSWDFGLLSNTLEGHYRPGHFDGVLTVVKRLFEIVQPDIAYFGEKDFQQLSLIRAMTQKEKMPLEVVGCPIIREIDGLAMSSRNTRLNEHDRHIASKISEVLFAMKASGKEHSPAILVKKALENLDAIEGISPEYLQIVDADTFKPVHAWEDSSAPIALMAAFVGDVRLIDNMWL